METSYEKNSASNLVRSPQPRPATSPDSEMLTPSEIEQLRQEQSARIDLLQGEFPGVKIHR